MSQRENRKVDPCFLAWVNLLEILEKNKETRTGEEKKEEN